jgi:hypothetical protein
MDFLDLILVVCGILFLIGIYFVFSRKQKKLPKQRAIFYAKKIFHTKKLDPAHAIMEVHKVFVMAGQELFGLPKNTKAADVMAKLMPRFSEKLQQDCWYFHRLRNRAAHQVDVKISSKEAEKCRDTFAQALGKMTMS